MAIAGILLALAVASQLLKNISVYITGPVVNLCLIVAVLTAGLMWGMAIATITPLTAFMLAPSPIMQAVPLIIPFIVIGNMTLVLAVHFMVRPFLKPKKITVKAVLAAIGASAIKAVIMGLTISIWILPFFLPEASPLRAKLPVFRMMFSVTQFVTCLMAFVYFFILWKLINFKNHI
jgi:hypothetical protein